MAKTTNDNSADANADTATDANASAASTEAAEPELSYEEAREELDNVVRRLESGGLTLKESLALWERGEQLAKTCEQWLEGARAKLAVALEESAPETESNGQNGQDAPF
ncbi:exodeoxyribonuclease VII small subunit [Nocardiopsis gilva YIM 90087]|uniref:Exodeoxyribonuclease 7 small subunit n=1 Tax=Nocardiopsis gilva YIM 90087 TaxID=1235441 RepID=A0A223S337_9ACTN|nr:exodeoxyribonuclease VII small subunit [Nocardiopsis gilva]ASU82528.1 exodeoxyribonuclease VII small subunit [Nocardiopsis gilva YIM 90087]